MHLVVDKLAEVLSAGPHVVLAIDRVGPRIPASGADIPAIAISVTFTPGRAAGLSRFVRSGDGLVQSATIIEVKASVDTFSGDLRVLRISPLPLRKNPSSSGNVLTDNDIQIRNVTNMTQPVVYRLVSQPTHKEEYRVDVPRAEVMFGEAQTAGEKLELTHWTLTWRDEIRSGTYRGSVVLEVWTESLTRTDQVSRKLQDTLKSQRALLREKGFSNLQPLSLGHVENVLHAQTVGSPFPVWKQRLEYQFAFEAEEGGELSSGIPIKRIEVDMGEEAVEPFSVP